MLDGSANLSELHIYQLTVSDDWRMREGGVLSTLGECGGFFNCISYYHSEKRTGIAGWDALFEKLKFSGNRKNIIPCMVCVYPSYQ